MTRWQEGRAATRRQLYVEVAVAAPGMLTHPGWLVDLSTAGMQVEATQSLRTGSRGAFTLVHRDPGEAISGSIPVEGLVRRCLPIPGREGFRIGVQFVDLPVETSAQLSRLLRRWSL